jgi:hypothetical protein
MKKAPCHSYPGGEFGNLVGSLRTMTPRQGCCALGDAGSMDGTFDTRQIGSIQVEGRLTHLTFRIEGREFGDAATRRLDWKHSKAALRTRLGTARCNAGSLHSGSAGTFFDLNLHASTRCETDESAAQKQVSKLPAGEPEGQIRTPVGRRNAFRGNFKPFVRTVFPA